MRVAAIDLGTNSFLCLIAEVESQKLTVKEDLLRVVKLGEGVHENKRFSPGALKRASDCLDYFSEFIQKHSPEVVLATATSAARDVENGDELIKMGKDKNIPIHIIPGRREAELSFIGTMSGFDESSNKCFLSVDVGGGSTEIVYQPPGQKIVPKSYDIGVVRLTEMFLKNDILQGEEKTKLVEYAMEKMKRFEVPQFDHLVAVAGTPTTFACMENKGVFNSSIDGFRLTRKMLRHWTTRLGAMTLEERKTVAGLDPKRADVIVAGGLILLSVLDTLNRDFFTVSTRGLRYGVALNWSEFQ